MRILHLTSHVEVGGITTSVVTLAQGLIRRGHRVVVAGEGGTMADRLTREGVSVWLLPLKTSAEFSPQVCWAAWQLRRQLSLEPVDLVHAHSRVAQVIAHWLWTRHRIPYVTTWHGFYRRRWSRRWFPCTGLLTVAISEPVSRHLQEVFHLPASKIRLIPHGVDVARFDQTPEPSVIHQFRERLRLGGDHSVIGTVTRLVHAKGVERLLQRFRDIRTRVPEAKLLIVGDGEARRHLEGFAKRLGVAEAVRFAGSVADTRVALSAMDLFVFVPAVQEGFGLSLLEAMASGLPIVAVKQGEGSSWVLETSGVGRVVSPDDADGFVEAVVHLLRDRAAARQLGAHARAVAKAHYDVGRMVTQTEQVYAEVVQGTPADHPRSF